MNQTFSSNRSQKKMEYDPPKTERKKVTANLRILHPAILWFRRKGDIFFFRQRKATARNFPEELGRMYFLALDGRKKTQGGKCSKRASKHTGKSEHTQIGPNNRNNDDSFGGHKNKN